MLGFLEETIHQNTPCCEKYFHQYFILCLQTNTRQVLNFMRIFFKRL
ncbi:hypothetical protein B4135_1452 [Caldibacillus debilis]|uniref:Uncharacterized protein n=1 Tax=Caldibacillus debilis TaxID=301148 RepID=A0A150MC00_9BACI|nr:hypothetical protein B4135_1452 [Caldibacillus debilis]